MRPGKIIRGIVALLISAPALALAVNLIAFETYGTGSGRGSTAFLFILLFPPGWTALIVINLRDQREMAWNQFFASSFVGIVVLQILILVWTIPFGSVAWPQRGDPPLTLLSALWMLTGIVGLLPILLAVHIALARLPKPLGQVRVN